MPMGRLLLTHYRKYRSLQNIAGLTLIEVLIALAIIAIALTAIIKGASQNIRATNYLETKMTALWIASDVVNEARAGLIKLPENEAISAKMPMLARDWYWELMPENTPNAHIKKMVVTVYPTEKARDAHHGLLTLETYLYAAQN
jgi:general secretion pathway protein I